MNLSIDFFEGVGFQELLWLMLSAAEAQVNESRWHIPKFVAANRTCGMSMIHTSICTDSHDLVVDPVSYENLCAKET